MNKHFKKHYRIPEGYFQELEKKWDKNPEGKTKSLRVVLAWAAVVILFLGIFIPLRRHLHYNRTVTDSIPSLEQINNTSVTTDIKNEDLEEEIVLDYLAMDEWMVYEE